MRFADYPLADSVLKDVAAAGYETPTPIQAGCIPLALAGEDVIGIAQTGTGKTAAYALPIIQRMAHRLELGALILAPTRELALQIFGQFEALGHSSGIRPALLVGGIPMVEDWRALSSWPNVVVATPGRLIDHVESGSVMLNEIEVLVVDEADRMHDMGFIPQIRRILEALPKKRQTMMFTATLPADVERIARSHMHKPERVQVGRVAPVAGAEQRLIKVNDQEKTQVLLEVLERTEGRVLVFVRTKRGVDHLFRAVRAKGHSVGRLHADRAMVERSEAMAAFREGRHRILIATDIAARGLDIADIEHVVNYDFPASPEDYVHRIGRTARLEAKGVATSFVTRADQHLVKALERLTGAHLPLAHASV